MKTKTCLSQTEFCTSLKYVFKQISRKALHLTEGAAVDLLIHIYTNSH